MSTETTARAATPTEFTDAEHSLLDAMNVPTNRIGRGLLFREMQRTGLDPFAKHLYLREDWNNKAERNVYAVASTIDGFRIVAARQSTYEGQTAPQWCDKNGTWTDAWWATDAPVAARIGVYVRGYREPMWGIARFSEYKPNGSAGFMWGKMAAHMIAKVAEALAIRKAYPDQLSGVYTDDEMQQVDARKDEQADSAERKGQRRPARADDEWNTATGQPLAPPAPGVPTVTTEQLGEIARLLKAKRGATNGNRNFIIGQLVRRPVENVRTLSQAEAVGIIETLAAEPDIAQADVAAPGTPNNPVISGAQQRMMQALFKSANLTDRDGQHQFIARVLGAPVASRNKVTVPQFQAIINALQTGEIPAPSAPTAADPGDEGISVLDALQQIISDARTPEEFEQARADIEREHAEDGISGDQLHALKAAWTDARNERQAKAGASA